MQFRGIYTSQSYPFSSYHETIAVTDNDVLSRDIDAIVLLVEKPDQKKHAEKQQYRKSAAYAAVKYRKTRHEVGPCQ